MPKSTATRAPARPTRRKLTAVGGTGLDSLRNLGPESARMLEAAGIDTRAALSELGAVGAYVAVKKKGLNPTLNLLYAIEAGLRDVPWTDLPYHVKAQLTLEADAYLDAEGMR